MSVTSTDSIGITPSASQNTAPPSPPTQPLNPPQSTTTTQQVAQPILKALPLTSRYGLPWGHPSHPHFQDGGYSRYDI